MPRLTNHNYLHQRHQLMRLLREQPQALARLSARAQADLHAFFQTTSLGSDQQLLAERRRLTASDPSLPQSAGRAYAALDMTKPQREPARVPAGKSNVYVRGVMRPDPDVKQLVRAFLKLADELGKQEREDENEAA